jgi:ABC-type Fe3+-hydroxamate transport system substrate-binding protein
VVPLPVIRRPPLRRTCAFVALALTAWVACGEAPRRKEAPRRIIAIAPSASEILFDLGLGDRVVGVGDYATWPEEVESLPRLGGLYDVRLEEIVALEPDLAVLIPSERELGERLGRLGIEVLTVESDSLEQIERAIVSIAERCAVPEAGERALGRFRDGLEPRPTASPLPVLVTMGREPGRLGSVMAAGGGTFVSELVERAGGINVFAGAGMPYPQIGAEELLARRPRTIVEIQYRSLSEAEIAGLLDDWRRLPGLPAVESGCVSVVDGTFTVIPGPRLPLLYSAIASALDRCEAGDD